MFCFKSCTTEVQSTGNDKIAANAATAATAATADADADAGAGAGAGNTARIIVFVADFLRFSFVQLLS